MGIENGVNENATATTPVIIERHEEESESSKIKKTVLCVAGLITAGVAIYCGY